MSSVVFTSIKEGSGKTSIMVGIMAAMKKNYGYIKPIGDRLIYKRKRNRDYDSNLVIDIFGLSEEPENITLGFDHSKLRFMYHDEDVKKAVVGLTEKAGKDRDGVFIESGKDIFYGASIKLDALSLARYTDSTLVLVVSGKEESILDELTFVNTNFDFKDSGLPSVIINKVHDIDEFKSLHLSKIEEMGYNVLGVLPQQEQLSNYTVTYLADRLYAKVVAGEQGMNKTVKNIFVGAMSTGKSLRNPLFNKENKFLITSGDRSDMILAALETDAVGILLTNNILPPPNIISLANEKNIPLLLVTMDTYAASRQVGRMETLLSRDDKDSVQLLTEMTDQYINFDKLFG